MPNEQRCLTLIGTASIQEYLFRSNRLKENLGASWLVADALNRWDREPWSKCYDQRVFIGGGNAALIFKDSETARNAIWDWSLDLCREAGTSLSTDVAAPGLRVLVVQVPYSTGGLKIAFKKAYDDLFRRENRAPSGWELGALPVVRPCASTGLAAAEFEDKQWLSTESAAKRRIAQRAKDNMQARYSDALNNGKLEFPDEFEQLGTAEGSSQIAIVHADGNAVGQILTKILNDASEDDLVERFERASKAICTLAQDAFRETLLDLTAALPRLKEESVSPSGKFYPLRPIVDGGDDLTFVCHGRLGLALAVRYLKHFERQSAKHYTALGIDQPLTACAGVMIVPGKFPFARAYHLAEQLSTNAKRIRRKNGNSNGAAGSWVDFQVVLEGTKATLAQTRDDWYWKGGSCLIRRPYRIGFDGDLGWESFEAKWKQFRSTGWPRSRAKRLLKALARGKDATDELLAEWGSRVPSVDDPWRIEEGGVIRTPYFDPLEMLDFHIDSSLFERSM